VLTCAASVNTVGPSSPSRSPTAVLVGYGYSRTAAIQAIDGFRTTDLSVTCLAAMPTGLELDTAFSTLVIGVTASCR
jgi:hypothetical protein